MTTMVSCHGSSFMPNMEIIELTLDDMCGVHGGSDNWSLFKREFAKAAGRAAGRAVVGAAFGGAVGAAVGVGWGLYEVAMFLMDS
ncbi:hypothetical protein [Rhodospirillum centenum]|uniref:hypothetical protein n=1 Tax=Rhodospirillum centenum TaxID=34018 RepID=UPI0011D10931|nr:hypothetical protein [Rhodospirillum centenum]